MITKIIIFIIGIIFSPQILAFTVGFGCISDNNSLDCGTGESQFFVEITEVSNDEILFTFLNSGPNESFISDIYFDSEYFLQVSSLIDADDGFGGDINVDFSVGAKPNNLPAGRSLSDPFVSLFGFSNDPGAANGIQVDESLGILFYLTNGLSYEGLINDLTNGAFRIGIHGQGFDGGGSESYVNTVTTVPIPLSFWLFGSGLVAFFVKSAKCSKYKNHISS